MILTVDSSDSLWCMVFTRHASVTFSLPSHDSLTYNNISYMCFRFQACH